MEKITVALSEEIAGWVDLQSAKSGHSASEWLACLLEGMKRQEDEYDTAMRDLLAEKPRKFKWAYGRRPTREDLHDCAGSHEQS